MIPAFWDDFIVFHRGGRKGQKHQPPDQKAETKMNSQIKKVITKHIEVMKMIIDRK